MLCVYVKLYSSKQSKYSGLSTLTNAPSMYTWTSTSSMNKYYQTNHPSRSTHASNTTQIKIKISSLSLSLYKHKNEHSKLGLYESSYLPTLDRCACMVPFSLPSFVDDIYYHTNLSIYRTIELRHTYTHSYVRDATLTI